MSRYKPASSSALYGTLKTFTITAGSARESGVLTTPLILPTTEPATAQFSYTIQTSDLPTISPTVPMKYNAAIYASGKIGATASTITYNLFKNSVSVGSATGVSAAATQFWAHTHWRTFDVQVGDVIEVRYSAAQADVNLDFHGLIVYPSQPEVSARGTILKDFSLSNGVNTPNFATATTVVGTGIYVFITGTVSTSPTSGTTSFPIVIPHASYGVFRNNIPEVVSAQSQQSVNATLRQIQKQYYPTTISFREMLG